MKDEGIYKVVVVEDEPKILRNIIRKIEKANPSFIVEGTASNGKEAIPVIDSIKPQVLFTDIRMPKMDGLELIKQVKNGHPDMQIIILSGYNEFEYAQKAIKLGVRGFLLKPVEESSLVETLSEVKTRLDATISSIRREILYSDIYGLSDNSQLPYMFGNSRFIILLVCLGNLCNHLPSVPVYNLYRDVWKSISLEGTLPNILDAGCKWWIVDEKQPNQKFIVISSPKLTPGDIQVLTNKLHITLCEKTTSHSVNICFDEQILTNPEIWDFAQKLRKTLDHGLIMGKSALITPNTIEVTGQLSALIDTTTLNRLNVLIQANNRNLLFQELASILNKWSQLRYPQRILEKSLYQLIRQCYSQTASISEVELNHLEYELSEKLAVSRNIQDISGDICLIFENMLASDSKDCDNSEELANRVEQYIRNHFTEPIGLEDIAAKFNFSISYITKIFKKYKNDTILKFLITIRINEAKRLIESRQGLELKNISEIVGYSDQHYFSRIFKNVTGISPSEYRDKFG